MMSEVRSDSELLYAIPKPTGLGMVSLSSFCFSRPLILLRLSDGHVPFAAAASRTWQYELLQRIPRPQREEGCVLLEFTDRRLGNLTWRMGSYESLQTESW